MQFFKKNKKKKIFGIVVLAVVLFTVGIFGSIIWQLHKDRVKIVDPGDVDPRAAKVLIARAQQRDGNVFNVLLVGTDSRDPDSDMGRSDSMMLVSFNRKQNKATIISFLRDSLVDIDGYGKSRLGHTYAYGGVGLTINTINKVYDLDVQNYVTINFENMVNVIDELGGVEVPITPEEAEYYRKCGMPNMQAGLVTLNGSQALAHSRNRSLDNDFGRARRQRDVMNGIYRKVLQKKDPQTMMSLINFCMTQVKTNMDVNEIFDWAMKVVSTENLTVQQISAPADGTYEFATYKGMAILEIDIEANKEIMDKMLY